ncbi:MAG TPA: hypothetical protein VLA04_01930 [Verrucomicrobiae bacterium]|nr:hypothetical protein [Verrucomicrobiae bacterium]
MNVFEQKAIPQDHLESPEDQLLQTMQREAADIVIQPEDRNKDGQLLASVHGLPSELPEEAWKLVRTESFKQWFGDWKEMPIARFMTAKGSVYSYDAEGKTTRFKTATNEQNERQDVTVFTKLDPLEEQDLLEVIHHGQGEKVYVAERNPDNTPRIIRDIADIHDEKDLYLVIMKDGRVTRSFPASSRPQAGYNTFDMRSYDDKDQGRMTERHLGNEVVALKYGESDTSKVISKNGEPLMVGDPASSDPEARVFLKAKNPYNTTRELWEKWKQESVGDRPDAQQAIHAALKQGGYDGLIIDGKPVLGSGDTKFFTDDQMLRVKLSTP